MAVDSISETGQPQLTGDVTLSAGAGIDLTQVGQDIEIGLATSSAYEAAVLADAPLGFYKENEQSGLAQDSSGNGAHMTASVGTNIRGYRVEGPMPGSSGIFNGVGANFSRAVLTAATANWTLETWVKVVDVVAGDDTVLLNGVRASSGYSLDIVSATLKFRALYGGVAFQRASTGTLVLNTWAYIVIIGRAGTLEYYLNGVLDSTGAESAPPNAPATKTQIGSDAAIAAVTSMSAVYNTAISAARVAAHYAAAGV